MVRKKILMLGLALAMSLSQAPAAFAEEASTTMENCGAYLFEWRPVDCGNGRYFAILVGGNTIAERNVILRRGFDYGYTFYPSIYPRTWGEVPALVNANGMWAIPENQPLLPEGTQPTLTITLVTNNKNLPFKERYIDVVCLPGGVSISELPSEVKKYLISVDGEDIGAYDDDSVTNGWIKEDDGTYRYRKPDGTYVSNGWLNIEDESYYMDANGIMLADTMSPDGYYINASGQKTKYIPGWTENERGKKYVLKNGYYAASTWVEDTDGKWYYFDMAGYLLKNETTPDGHYVDENGVWDGQESTIVEDITKYGPAGKTEPEAVAYWEQTDDGWKYKQEDGSYLTNSWAQGADGGWYYLGTDGLMLTSQTTPDGYYVDENGLWSTNAVSSEAEGNTDGEEAASESEKSETSAEADNT